MQGPRDVCTVRYSPSSFCRVWDRCTVCFPPLCHTMRVWVFVYLIVFLWVFFQTFASGLVQIHSIFFVCCVFFSDYCFCFSADTFHSPNLFRPNPFASCEKCPVSNGVPSYPCLLTASRSSSKQNISQERCCLDNYTCCHIEIQAADQICFRT